MVWVSHPEIYAVMKKWLPPSVPMLCDCMDDCLEFSEVKSNPKKLKWLSGFEREMLDRADLIFASSANLRQALLNRYELQKQIVVVNNGVQIESAKSELPMQDALNGLKQRGLHLVSYIGTVSDWLDTELLIMALERFPSVAFTIFGPVDSRLPKHERIISFGPIEHKQVFTVMDASDALVMPFCVTPLIESVNPVKLYEYIYSGKPTLAVAYGETEKFSDYVYLYRDQAGFMTLMEMLVNGILPGKRSLESCRSFALSNTWESRVQKMLQAIDEVCMHRFSFAEN
jgi:glycosyltransferase involved in cell wall biosynthesis